jgi:hypothetical protein
MADVREEIKAHHELHLLANPAPDLQNPSAVE